jgi:hypothetical protein
MKIPKTIQKFLDKHPECRAIPVTYKAQGIKLKRKGWDIVLHNDGNDSHPCLIALEPVSYRHYPEKWLVRDHHQEYKGPMRVVKISHALAFVDVSKKTSYWTKYRF